MTAPRLRDGPKERRGKPPLHLPASAKMGRAVRGKRSTTPPPRGESLPRPTSRGCAEDPRLVPAPFAQSYPFVCYLIAPPRPSRARPCSECGSCPCPRWSIWGWDPKEAQHLGGGGLPDTPSAEGTGPHFRKGRFRECSVQPGHLGLLPGKPSALKSPRRPFCPSPLCRRGQVHLGSGFGFCIPSPTPLPSPGGRCRGRVGPQVGQGVDPNQRMWGARCSGVSSPRDERRSSVSPLDTPCGNPVGARKIAGGGEAENFQRGEIACRRWERALNPLYAAHKVAPLGPKGPAGGAVGVLPPYALSRCLWGARRARGGSEFPGDLGPVA
jgi:hypothetical protein